jgi:hypothetical protein
VHDRTLARLEGLQCASKFPLVQPNDRRNSIVTAVKAMACGASRGELRASIVVCRQAFMGDEKDRGCANANLERNERARTRRVSVATTFCTHAACLSASKGEITGGAGIN